MSALAFLYSEKLVAEQMGISRTEARELRSLLEDDVDWKKDRAGIVMSLSGVERLAKAVNQALPNLDLCRAEKNGHAGPEKKTMRVARIPLNTRIVLATDSAGVEQIVDVGNSKTFVIGDKMEVVMHEAQKGVWRLTSQVPRDRRRPYYSHEI